MREIKTKIRSFVNEYEDEVIHVLEHHDNEFILMFDDAHEQRTGDVKFINNKKQLKDEYGINW